MSNLFKGLSILALLLAGDIYFLNVALGFMLNTDSSLLVFLTPIALVAVVFGNIFVYNKFVKGNLYNVE
jgi:hypothetical protein